MNNDKTQNNPLGGNKMKSKKLLSIIISVMMIVTMLLPATVYADDEGVYVSDCDSTSGWSCYIGDGMAVDTSVKTQGKGSLKFWQIGGFCGLYKLQNTIDISQMSYFVFDMLPQATDWFEKAGYAYLVISSRQDGGGYDEPDSAEWTEKGP